MAGWIHHPNQLGDPHPKPEVSIGEQVAQFVKLRGEDWGPHVVPAAAKLFADGVIESRTAALLTGDLDVIEHVPSADIKNLNKNNKLRVMQTTSWRTILLHLDQYRTQPPGVTDAGGKPLAKNPFMDIRVRKAMSKAIHRSAIAERVMEGLAVPAANIVSPGVFGYNAALIAVGMQADVWVLERSVDRMRELDNMLGGRITVSISNRQTVEDAIEVRSRVLSAFERAEAERDDARRAPFP